jgi:hypothetical protein
VQRLGSAEWDRVAALDDVRHQVATIEALMFACESPPILITLVEDLYQSLDRLEDRHPSLGQSRSLLDAG